MFRKFITATSLFLLLFCFSCSKQTQDYALFHTGEKTIRVDKLKFYNNKRMDLYLYIEDSTTRNSIYNTTVDSLSLHIKDSTFTGKPQLVMMNAEFTTDFILPLNRTTKKIEVDTIMGKPMFRVPFVKNAHLPRIESDLIETEAIKTK